MQTKDVTYRLTLERAIAVAGSDIHLAIRLRTTPEQLAKWLYGVEPIPDQTFLEAVDLVVTDLVLTGKRSSPN